MDIRKVKKLIEMLEESKISEIEIHEGEESVRISKHTIFPDQEQTLIHVPAGNSTQAQVNELATENSADEALEPEGRYIRSPMVGIFYSSPSPDKPPFIEHGKEVKVGDVVCIIEAMKIMNQIESDVDGVVNRVMVDNGEPVEYGQPLFLIREA